MDLAAVATAQQMAQVSISTSSPPPPPPPSPPSPSVATAAILHDPSPPTIETTATTTAPSPPEQTSTRRLVPHPRTIPVTIARSYLIDGVNTDAFVQLFQDRIFMGISQVSSSSSSSSSISSTTQHEHLEQQHHHEQRPRIGNYLLCQATRSIYNPATIFDYQFDHLLGSERDNAVYTVLARQLMQGIMMMTNHGEGGNDHRGGAGDAHAGAGSKSNHVSTTATTTRTPGNDSVVLILAISLANSNKSNVTNMSTQSSTLPSPAAFHALVDTLLQLYQEAVTYGS